MRTILFILILFGFQRQLKCQSDYLTNPSFDGTPSEGYTPAGWSKCNPGCTPDLQPGIWGINNPPSDKSSYVGLVMRDNANSSYPYKNEDIQTTLLRPLFKGERYKIYIDLAFTPNLNDGTGLTYQNPPYLRIIGGNSICDTAEVLQISPLITNTNWQTYEFDIMPLKDTYKVLKLEIYSKPLVNSYLLLDNIRIHKVLPEAAELIIGSNDVCPGQNSVFYSIPSIYNATSYKWEYTGTGANIQVNSNNIIIDFSDNATSGNLRVFGENDNGPGIASADYWIEVAKLPAQPGEIIGSKELCKGKGESGISFNVPNINFATNYIWSYTGSGTILNEKDSVIIMYYAYNATGGILTVKGKNKCGYGPESPSLNISIVNCQPDFYNIKIPNSFTPNSDGVNDEFYITGLIPNSKLTIFDRSGKVLYSSNDYQNNWDGISAENKVLETGTYWYVLTIPGLGMDYKGFIYLKR